MNSSRRLMTLLGLGAASAFAALALPLAAAHAEDGATGTQVTAPDNGIAPGYGGGTYETCDGGVCLVMGKEDLNDWTYKGIRPFLTDWKGVQQYEVEYNPATANNPPDGLATTTTETNTLASINTDTTVTTEHLSAPTTTATTIDAGSYEVKTEDFWSPLFTSNAYEFGKFVPSADAPATAASEIGWYGDMSDSSIYKVSLFDGDLTNLTMNNIGPHDADYWVVSTPNFTNTIVTVDGASADYIKVGDDAPVFLWNSLFHSGLEEAAVPTFLIPDDAFAGTDFEPTQYLDIPETAPVA